MRISMKNNEAKKILIVDDESEMRVALETTLKREKYQLTCAEDGKQALDKIEDDDFDLILTDVRMPKLNGLELLRAVKEKSPKTQVVMMTAYGTIDNAVEAMKEGAFDYLIKGSGFSADVLVSTVKRAFLDPGSFIPPYPSADHTNGIDRGHEKNCYAECRDEKTSTICRKRFLQQVHCSHYGRDRNRKRIIRALYTPVQSTFRKTFYGRQLRCPARGLTRIRIVWS
jgi:CheY-like chemotaxis protein